MSGRIPEDLVEEEYDNDDDCVEMNPKGGNFQVVGIGKVIACLPISQDKKTHKICSPLLIARTSLKTERSKRGETQ